MAIEERIEQKLDKLTEEHSNMRVDVKGIATKMDILVGRDGTNGIIKDHHERIKALEGRSSYVAGFFGAVSILVTVAWHWAKRKIWP